MHRTLPRTERATLGQKIYQLFLEVIELTYIAAYLPFDQKITGLDKIISRLDILKLFLQVAWENKFIPDEKYIELSAKLQEIGRMLGGWKKGILSKTPAH